MVGERLVRVIGLIAVTLGFAFLPVSTSVGSVLSTHPGKSAARLAQVRYIDHGLSVQPPNAKMRAGKTKMPLYNQYLLRTGTKQRASIRFRDKTTLHINQKTDAVLRSPHLTYVQKGAVDEVLAPGTDHRVQTAAAIASAIGTNYEVRVQKGRTEVIVEHGAVEVKNKRGRVIVKTNQETIVTANQKPSPPQAVDAARAISWTQGIPAPVLGDNLALDANGGQVVAETSQRSGGPASRIQDGQTDTAWESGSGSVTNQSVTIGFEGTKIFQASGVIIDGSAAKGVSPQTDLKDFAIQYSNSNSDDKSFSTLFQGTLKPGAGLTKFAFGPIGIRYLRLVAKNNYGSADGISVAELEVVGTPNTGKMFDFSEGVAVNPQGNVDVADGGFAFIQRVSPDGKLLATLGEPGTDSGHIHSPRGLAEDAAGNIYLMNFGDRMLKLSPQGKVLAEWGSSGSGNGQFSAANGVAVDTQGNVYVADSNANRIQKFSSSGQFLAAFGGAPRSIGNVLGVAVDNQGNMYASSGPGDYIVKLSPSGQEITRWGTGGKGPGQFSHPVGLALDKQGNLYVADAQNSRVQKFTSGGQYLTSWPTPGDTPATPLRPEYLAVDASGNVYVTYDAHGSVVQKFSPTGQLLGTWK